MPSAYTEHYTLIDYQQWLGDWELVQGSAFAMTPSPSVSHQITSVNVVAHLKDKLEGCAHSYALMETDWEIANDTVVRPDVLVICYEPDERITKAPILIFEVISASTAKRDEQLKYELYQKEGVKYYGIIYPEKRIAKVYQLITGHYQKVGDFTDETSEFEICGCKIQFDFNLIWRKPRS